MDAELDWTAAERAPGLISTSGLPEADANNADKSDVVMNERAAKSAEPRVHV
jgi:CRISPR/Cas system CMR-associated protein Cmr3 (group 5 of RAMP superfamily)